VEKILGRVDSGCLSKSALCGKAQDHEKATYWKNQENINKKPDNHHPN
jgi:hypothetical protein